MMVQGMESGKFQSEERGERVEGSQVRSPLWVEEELRRASVSQLEAGGCGPAGNMLTRVKVPEPSFSSFTR